jgi:hypothetical protein
VNSAETITAIITLGVISLAALAVLAAAREWVGFAWSASVRFIPAAKRQPRTPDAGGQPDGQDKLPGSTV